MVHTVHLHVACLMRYLKNLRYLKGFGLNPGYSPGKVSNLKASVILIYAWEFWERYLYLHVLVNDHFPMRRFKTYTCITMISKILNGISLLHVHQETFPDLEKVIDLFKFQMEVLVLFDVYGI